jgi:hypothetical protein
MNAYMLWLRRFDLVQVRRLSILVAVAAAAAMSGVTVWLSSAGNVGGSHEVVVATNRQTVSTPTLNESQFGTGGKTHAYPWQGQGWPGGHWRGGGWRG